jgi:hypothetical protein
VSIIRPKVVLQRTGAAISVAPGQRLLRRPGAAELAVARCGHIAQRDELPRNPPGIVGRS